MVTLTLLPDSDEESDEETLSPDESRDLKPHQKRKNVEETANEGAKRMKLLKDPADDLSKEIRRQKDVYIKMEESLKVLKNSTAELSKDFIRLKDDQMKMEESLMVLRESTHELSKVISRQTGDQIKMETEMQDIREEITRRENALEVILSEIRNISRY